jgi:hypothetical protein
MRPRSVVVAAFVALVIVVGFLTPLKGVAGQQWAVYQFDKPTRIGDKFVCGKVVFVHDMTKMAKGEPCTEVYQVMPSGPNKLITAFHCRPLNRGVVEKFTVTIGRSTLTPGTLELREYQFQGDDEGHGVPGLR